jgi:hypothetical protein
VVKEAVTKVIFYVPDLAQEEPESVDMQMGKFIEAIQQLQEWIIELEIQAVSRTPQ